MIHRVIVIMQPYFLPYRNYYGLIHNCDNFVIFDDVQFCRGWQQRNAIPDGRGGKLWLTVPIVSRRPRYQLIREVCIADDQHWRTTLLNAVKLVYWKHPRFDDVYRSFEAILNKAGPSLIDLNVDLLRWSARSGGVRNPQWHWSSAMSGRHLGRTERLIEICRALDATEYLCGPAAKAYLDVDLFRRAGIRVIWHEPVYGSYPQCATTEFDHYVSWLDLLMNCGINAVQHLKPIHET